MSSHLTEEDLDSMLSDFSTNNKESTYEKFSVYNSNSEDGDAASRHASIDSISLNPNSITSPHTQRSQAKSISSCNELLKSAYTSPSTNNSSPNLPDINKDPFSSENNRSDKFERQIEIKIRIDDEANDVDDADVENDSDFEDSYTQKEPGKIGTEEVRPNIALPIIIPVPDQFGLENSYHSTSSSSTAYPNINKSKPNSPNPDEFRFSTTAEVLLAKPLPSIPIIEDIPVSKTKIKKEKQGVSIDSIPKQIRLIQQLSSFNDTRNVQEFPEIDSKEFKNIQEFGKFLLSYLTNLSNFELIMSDENDSLNEEQQKEGTNGKLLTDNLFISNEIWFNNSLVIKDCSIKIDIMHDINKLLINLVSSITSKEQPRAQIEFNQIDTSLLYYEKLLNAYNVYEIPVLQIQYNNEKYNSLDDKENLITPQLSTSSNSSSNKSNSINKYSNNRRLSNQSYSINGNNNNNLKTRNSTQSNHSQTNSNPNSKHASWNNNNNETGNTLTTITSNHFANLNTRTVYKKLSFLGNKFKHKRSISNTLSNSTNSYSIKSSLESNGNSNNLETHTNPIEKSRSNSNSNYVKNDPKLSVQEIKQQKYDYYKCLIILKENYQILIDIMNQANDFNKNNFSLSDIENFRKILEFLVRSIVRFNLIDVLLLNVELIKNRLDLFLKH